MTAPAAGHPRHFIDLSLISRETLWALLDRAAALKAAAPAPILPGKTLAMIFEKPSTRTRVSFEVGMNQMGGQAVVLSANDMQLGRGETIEDTARVLSRYVDAIMLRTAEETKLLALARYASVPVINGLTDRSHPCQILADVMTMREHLGRIEGVRVAWIGDFNNVARSFVHGAVQFGFEIVLATPAGLAPPRELSDWVSEHGGRMSSVTDPMAAAAGADVVVTDTWVSMSDRDGKRRRALLAPYQVTEAIMAAAKSDAIFLHCLPAHRGEEVAAGVIDGPRSVVWDEAENRLHAQKAILAWCMGA